MIPKANDIQDFFFKKAVQFLHTIYSVEGWSIGAKGALPNQKIPFCVSLNIQPREDQPSRLMAISASSGSTNTKQAIILGGGCWVMFHKPHSCLISQRCTGALWLLTFPKLSLFSFTASHYYKYKQQFIFPGKFLENGCSLPEASPAQKPIFIWHVASFPPTFNFIPCRDGKLNSVHV